MADASPYKLRLSHAADWVGCAAYVAVSRTPQAAVLAQAAPHVTREEGTAMHWVAQQWLTFPKGATHIQERPPGVDDVAPNGVVITDELFDGAMLFVDTLRSYGSGWMVEQPLQAKRIHPTECGGTPDAYKFFESFEIVSFDGVNIRVADLKGGRIPVEVFPNWQLIGYLAAILDANALCYDHDEMIVEFMVVQPRAYHKDGPVRAHKMRVGDVRPYFADLSKSAYAALGENAAATSGPQCHNCNGRAACKVALRAAGHALEIGGEPDIHDLPVNAIDYEMQRLEEAAAMIEARLTGLQAQATHLIRSKGATLPHYALESGPGRVVWIDEAAERSAIALGDLLGVDIRKPAKAMTPKQTLDKLPKDLIDGYAYQKRGAVKLVRFDNDAAVKAFSHLKLNKD